MGLTSQLRSHVQASRSRYVRMLEDVQKSLRERKEGGEEGLEGLLSEVNEKLRQVEP